MSKRLRIATSTSPYSRPYSAIIIVSTTSYFPLFLDALFPDKNSKKFLITAHMNSIISLSLLDMEALPSYDLAPSRRTGMTHSIIGATARHTRLVGMERRLAAILSADVQGYSRLMHEDETATIQTLTAYRGLMASLIRQYRGRVVDDPGDNVLAEFPSVVEAVQCAVTIQRTLAARNAALPPQRQMVFRMGLHLGDIVVEQERIYGAAVNLAARLERVAEGGGLCISGTVYDHVVAKLPLETIKDVPIKVYVLPGVETYVSFLMEQSLDKNPGWLSKIRQKINLV